MQKRALVILATVVLVAIFASATLIFNMQKNNQISAAAMQNAAFLMREHSPVSGDPNARVTIVEFFDPACATCKDFHLFIKQIMDAHPGRINLVMRYTPLHTGSDEVVRILEAARVQGKFWETLQATYDTQAAWAINHISHPENLWKILAYTDLDMERAQQDAQSLAVARRIQQDIDDAQQLQVKLTPGFFVNGNPLVEFGYNQLQALIESEIRNNY